VHPVIAVARERFGTEVVVLRMLGVVTHTYNRLAKATAPSSS
jgi:type IV secretory pathway TraG/TraD family ATPase VirD4